MSTLKIEHITNIGRSGEDLSIDTNGKVGIGTTSPDRNLHVKETTTGGTVAKFENTAGTVYIELNTNNQVGADAGYIAYDSNQDLSFWPSDSRAMTLKADGKVGIGTTDPGSPLQVNGTVIVGNTDFGEYDSTHGNLMVSNGASATSILLYNDGGAYHSSLIQYDTNVLKLGLNNANTANTLLTTSAINVNATGVGIGTDSPSSLLTLHGSQPIITLSDPDTSSTTTISGNSGHLIFNADSGGNASSNTIDFQIDNDQKVRINDSGNVGIGTTSIPSADSAYLTVGTQDYAISHNGFSKNSYFDGSNYTAVTNAAGKLIQMGDDIIFYHSPTVAAGAAQTQTALMTLKANGNNLRPSQSGICLTLSASQGIPGSGTWAWEKINLNTVIYQNGNTSAWDSGNTRYTCPETGLYLVTTSIQLENNGSAVWRYLFPCINGATSPVNGMNFADFVPQDSPNATYYHHTHSCILKCSSGDYIEWRAHGSGGGSTVKPSTETACAIYFLG